MFSFWNLHSPKTAAEYMALGTWHVTGEQTLCAHRLHTLVMEQLKQVPADLAGAGRGPATLLSLVDMLSASAKNVPISNKNVSDLINTQAMELTAENAGLPENAGVLYPADVLEPDKARDFVDFESRILKPGPTHEVLPKPCLRISAKEERKLRRRLLQSNMGQLVPEADIPVDDLGRLILGGMFGVPHKLGKLRVIFDRRPLNLGESRLKWVELPQGCMFIRVVLRPGEHIRGSGGDLSKYFYQLSNVPEALRRNCFGRRITGTEAAELGGDPKVAYRMGLRVIGMGDHNAVDVAQCTHQDVLKSNNALGTNGLMVYGSPLPPGKLFQGIYIDDLLVAYIIDEDADVDTEPDKVLMKRAQEAYKHWNLPRAFEKDFGYGKDDGKGDKKFIAWGTGIDSDPGHVGTPAEKRTSISFGILASLPHKRLPKYLLIRVLALAIHPFMHMRILLSCMHHIYKFLAQYHSDYDIVKMPADIIDELAALAMLLLIAVADIRAQPNTYITSTDATTQAVGATGAQVSNHLSLALYNSCQCRGAYMRLDDNLREFPISELHKLLPEDPVVREMSKCLHWSVIHEQELKESQHVNLQEMREIIWALKYHCGVSLTGNMSNQTCHGWL